MLEDDLTYPDIMNFFGISKETARLKMKKLIEQGLFELVMIKRGGTRIAVFRKK